MTVIREIFIRSKEMMDILSSYTNTVPAVRLFLVPTNCPFLSSVERLRKYSVTMPAVSQITTVISSRNETIVTILKVIGRIGSKHT